MVIFSGLMIAAAAHVRALEWNTFSINQNPVPPNAIVSFAIGYPKGWQVSQDSNWRHDIYFGLAVGPRGEAIAMITPLHPNLISTELTLVAIFYGHDRPAKEAAESFARGYTKESLSPVRTASGDSGWLLESERVFKIGGPITKGGFTGSGLSVQLIPAYITPVGPTVEKKFVDQQYFFHSGSKGSIRVEITTPAGNSVLRSELDKLVLRTLRFGNS
jgi:hypothetical protein